MFDFMKKENKQVSLYATHFNNQPCLVDPRKVSAFSVYLQSVPNSLLMEQANMPDEDYWSGEYADFRPYKVRDGVLTIPVQGVLLNRFPYQFGGFATGYDYIRAAISRGMDDPQVNSIVLDIDSPGGMVSGCFELAEFMYDKRDKKPMRATVDGMATSAAYAIASATKEIYATQSSYTGSIGVVMMHVNASGFLAQMGFEVTFVYAGEKKIDGNPYEALPERVRQDMQASVDATYRRFTSMVARFRNLDEEMVIGTQAGVYRSNEALREGLIDVIADVDGFLTGLTGQNQSGEFAMQNTPDSAAVDMAAANAARAEGVAEGQKAERARVKAIMATEEAKARPEAALHIALESDMSAEVAVSLLAKLPAEKKEEAASSDKMAAVFDAAMVKTGNPNVGVAGGEAVAKDEHEEQANALLASYKAVTGIK